MQDPQSDTLNTLSAAISWRPAPLKVSAPTAQAPTMGDAHMAGPAWCPSIQMSTAPLRTSTVNGATCTRKRRQDRVVHDPHIYTTPFWDELVEHRLNVPRPGPVALHMHDKHQLKSVKHIDKLPEALVALFEAYHDAEENRDVLSTPISERSKIFFLPKHHENVDTIDALLSALKLRERIPAAIASALLQPKKTSLVEEAGFIQWRPESTDPACDAPGEGYVVLKPSAVPICDETVELRANLEAATEAGYAEFIPFVLIKVGRPYTTDDIVNAMNDIAVYNVVDERGWTSHICDENDVERRNCGSPIQCQSILTERRAVSGRPTGRDSHVIKDLLSVSENVVRRQPEWVSRMKDDVFHSAMFCYQRAWTVGDSSDATFINIVTGDVKFICIRERETQTLYVSDPIDMSLPPSANSPLAPLAIETGQFIMGTNDVLARTAIGERDIQDGSLPWTALHGHDMLSPEKFSVESLRLTYHIELGCTLPLQMQPKPLDPLEEASDQFNLRNALHKVGGVHVHWGQANLGERSCLLRLQSPLYVTSIATTHGGPSSERVHLHIHAPMRHGDVYVCYLVGADGQPDQEKGPMVVKFGSGTSTGRSLQQEYEILLAICGVEISPSYPCATPIPFGIFSDDTNDTFALLMQYIPKPPLTVAVALDFTDEYLGYQLENWLSHLRGKNITHGRLRPEHILYDDYDHERPGGWRAIHIVGWSGACLDSKKPALDKDARDMKLITDDLNRSVPSKVPVELKRSKRVRRS